MGFSGGSLVLGLLCGSVTVFVVYGTVIVICCSGVFVISLVGGWFLCGCLTTQVVLWWFVIWLLCCVVRCSVWRLLSVGIVVCWIGVNSVGHVITHYCLLVWFVVGFLVLL